MMKEATTSESLGKILQDYTPHYGHRHESMKSDPEISLSISKEDNK
jgi:hypothetical protein